MIRRQIRNLTAEQTGEQTGERAPMELIARGTVQYNASVRRLSGITSNSKVQGPMSYSTDIDHDHQLINVTYRGNVSIRSRSDAHQETLLLLAETGYRHILIDYSAALPQVESFDDINRFVSRVSGDPVLRRCRIAFVGRRGQLFNTTVETLAGARHYPFKRHYDRDSAIGWLGDPFEPTRQDRSGPGD